MISFISGTKIRETSEMKIFYSIQQRMISNNDQATLFSPIDIVPYGILSMLTWCVVKATRRFHNRDVLVTYTLSVD